MTEPELASIYQGPEEMCKRLHLVYRDCEPGKCWEPVRYITMKKPEARVYRGWGEYDFYRACIFSITVLFLGLVGALGYVLYKLVG